MAKLLPLLLLLLLHLKCWEMMHLIEAEVVGGGGVGG